ncbi:hypothetical protein RCF53_00885, partial [Staphylococcus aureus]|nr:hypothetical protein [Staphylococcus aureus]
NQLETQDRVFRSLGILPKYLSAFEKDVMYLMCEQYKPREIAQLMHVKEKVIYNAIQRCKNKIKRYFKMI